MPISAANTPSIQLPARLCSDVAQALRHEWLVTNGLGGFASGTVAGALTRRYHGLLLAALRPPLGRTLLVAKLDETVALGREDYPLHTNVWRDGVGPDPGCRWLRRFDLLLGVPTWSYEPPGSRLTKRIWMEPGRNTTYVQYELAGSSHPLVLTCTLLVNFRDYHALRHHADGIFEVERSVAAGPRAGRDAAAGPRAERPVPAGPRAGRTATGLWLRATDGGVPTHVCCQRNTSTPAEWTPDHTWYRDFRLPADESRGFDHFEDHLCAARCRVSLQPGQMVTFVLSAEDAAAEFDTDGVAALARREDMARAQLAAFEQQSAAPAGTTTPALRQLVLAADQFIVTRQDVAAGPRAGRPVAAGPRAGRSVAPAPRAGRTVLAGYPWFTDWGRDTMIALPGLTLCTGRFDVARQILQTWGRRVDRGLIPNRFPDRGDTPEYHTADAALWFLWAIDQYARASGDRQTLADLFPVMTEIVACHRRGTRHNIRVDDDGLLYAGEQGVNLTWMDAKIGERVITPRMGKPVELSALWYDALCSLARLAEWLGKPAGEYRRLAERTRRSFARFFSPARDCCYDVLDGPGGDDARLRPNQVFAVSLSHSPLAPEQQRAVVSVCQRELLTPFGLRSLAPGEPGYRGRYAGDLQARDQAYHQGTVWGWLLGPFVVAHYRVHRNAAQARRFLEPMLGQLATHGVGSLSEIFDSDPPHEPKGCIAQAWSVAETLRAWQVTQNKRGQSREGKLGRAERAGQSG